jgi:hypothetical protein
MKLAQSTTTSTDSFESFIYTVQRLQSYSTQSKKLTDFSKCPSYELEPNFLDRRLKEPDFKLMKSFMAEFTNTEKQLTSIEYIKHKKEENEESLDPRSPCPIM